MVDFSSTPLQHVCCCGHNMQDAGPTGAPQHGAQQEMRAVPRCQRT